MKLADLVSMWEGQDRRCYQCSSPLPDPRVIVSGVKGKGRAAKIDHDHKVCQKKSHSCDRCRRGLACNACNTHVLSMRTAKSTGFWVPPEGNDLRRWLEFLGPADRDRLRDALALFPGTGSGKSRRRSQGEAEVIPLFDAAACA